jgi:hypothetical protein
MSRARIVAAAGVLLTVAGVWLLHPRTGVVSGGGHPLAGAVVRYQGGRCAVVTDRHGCFDLPMNGGKAPRVTAWKAGYAIGSAPAAQLPLAIHLVPLPAQDNDSSYSWIDATPNPRQLVNCGNCHAQIYDEWASSGHARAATNPRFLQEYQKLATDSPEKIGVCAKCHAPTLRDPTLNYDLRIVKGVDRQGVHCDFCHKVLEAPTDKLGTRFGDDGYQLLRPRGDQQLFFGPLDDAVREGEQFGFAPLYRRSGYCASCHEGIIFGVHVYGTYSEWLASPARLEGKECQSCHMASTGRLTNIAPGKGGIERDPATLASHEMPGGTAAMLRRCLSLKASVQGGCIDVEVLADRVGHRVPTGFIDRNLILLVDARNGDGKPGRLTAGPTVPDAVPDFGSLPGKVFGKRAIGEKMTKPISFWQPHDDVLDTRLFPGQTERLHFEFSGPLGTVRIRLLYQRLWSSAERIVVAEW